MAAWEEIQPDSTRISGWFETLSHNSFDAVDHATGLYCLHVANLKGRRRDGSGWVLTPLGDPLPVAEIASRLRITVDRAEQGLRKLGVVGTMTRLDSGVWSFPKLREWQPSSEGERSRRRRTSTPSGQMSFDQVPVVPTVENAVARPVAVPVVQAVEIAVANENPHPIATGTAGTPSTLTTTTTTTTCAHAREERPRAVLTFPARGGQRWDLNEDHLASLGRVFPALNVLAEMQLAACKVETGACAMPAIDEYPRFVMGWLRRATPGPKIVPTPPVIPQTPRITGWSLEEQKQKREEAWARIEAAARARKES